jgi:hypothetical protein
MPRRRPEPAASPSPLVDHDLPQELGELFDASGWPRLAGRLMGELMLADPPYLSTTQLCERLETSKGHLSSTMKLLVLGGLVERFGVSGSRMDHYRVPPDAFVRAVQHSVEPMTRLADLADRAAVRLPPGSIVAEQVTQMRDLYRFLAAKFPALIDEFNQQRSPTTSNRGG